MKRENLLIGLVLFLVLLNGFVLLRQNRGGGPRHDGPPPHDRLIIKTLNFDESQQRSFEELKFDHRRKIVELERKFETTLEEYFLLLSVENQSKKDSLESIVADLEKQKADITFQHFKDLRNLCRPDQREAFDQFIPELFRFIMPPSPRNLPPPRRNP
jgi:periplasmic protein CpxP/Spy